MSSSDEMERAREQAYTEPVQVPHTAPGVLYRSGPLEAAGTAGPDAYRVPLELPDDEEERKIQLSLEASRRMLRMRELAAEQAHVEKLRDALVADYEHTIGKLRSELQDEREQLGLISDLYGGTLRLPHVGTIGRRKPKKRLALQDEERALLTVQAALSDELVDELAPRKLAKGKARAWAENHAKETGEILEGFLWEPVPGGITVRFDDTQTTAARESGR